MNFEFFFLREECSDVSRGRTRYLDELRIGCADFLFFGVDRQEFCVSEGNDSKNFVKESGKCSCD